MPTQVESRASEQGRSLIERVAVILEAFTSCDDALSASEVARRTGIPMPSTHRIVNDMVRTGMLDRDEQLGLRIGMRMWEVAARSTRILGLRETALPFMEDLFAVVKAPTLLSVLDRGDVVNLETLAPRRAMATNITQPGTRLPALVSSPGLVLIAFSAPEARDDLLETAKVTRFTPHTVVDRAELRRHVEEARRAGFAVVHRWISPVSTGVAVPVVVEHGRAVAALSVTVPFDAGVPSDLLPALLTTARGISRALREGSASSPEVTLLKHQVRRATEVR